MKIDWPQLVNWLTITFISVVLTAISTYIFFRLQQRKEREREIKETRLRFQRELYAGYDLPPANIKSAVERVKSASTKSSLTLYLLLAIIIGTGIWFINRGIHAAHVKPTSVYTPIFPLASRTPTLPTHPLPSATPSARPMQIMFTFVPPLGSSEELQGTVEGVNPEMYGVAVYIKVGGGWWTKPYFASPVTIINSDGTWNCLYAIGGNDTSATVLRAYLIPIGYKPPAMSGGSSLPSVLEKNAVAMVEATR